MKVNLQKNKFWLMFTLILMLMGLQKIEVNATSSDIMDGGDSTEACITHTQYWNHTDDMGEDAYDLKCSTCDMNLGRGYKSSDGYYYLSDTENIGSFEHFVYDADANLIDKESCQESVYIDYDEKYHIASCKCHLILDEKQSHTFKKEIKQATPQAAGMIKNVCDKCGHIETEKIKKVKTVSLSYTSKKYSGKKLKPTVKVKDSAGKTISSKYYSVTYSNNKNTGIATVTINLKGNYKGKIKKTFQILPKETKLINCSPQINEMSVSWKKQTGKISGYEIQYSTNSDFKSAKVKKINSASTTKTTLKALKENQNYYVRVRVYKTVKINGKTKKLTSSWSGKKRVKTKERLTEATTQATTQPATQTTTEKPTTPPSQPTTEAPTPQPSENMVWIPNSGTKYHSKSTCSNMINPTQVSLSDAIRMGYEPCKRCH